MSRFAKYAWFITGILVLVILWGAVVRATGSGAGCGNHWPLCDGEIIPTPETIERVIEFGHRVTSGLSGILVLVMTIWAFRAKFEFNQRAIRIMAVLSLVFIIIEGGLGAALVRFELVAENASSTRAIVIALHLANTLVLLCFSTLTAWFASLNEAVHFGRMTRLRWGIVFGLLAYIFLSAIGAVTALGDTLFPSESLAAGLQLDLDPTAHFLIQLRVWHPVVAIVVSAYLFAYAYFLRQQDISDSLDKAINVMMGLITLQVVAGFINVGFLAPLWMQLVHLLLADALWIVLVVLSGMILTNEKQKSAE